MMLGNLFPSSGTSWENVLSPATCSLRSSRGKIRKRLFRVDIDGPLPEPGTPVRHGEKEVGVMRSGLDGIGIALLRIEQVEAAAKAGDALSAGDARLTPVKPDWAVF